MALTNAEKQARWRERHAMKRHAVQRISKAILRRQWSDDTIPEIASALRSVLNTAGIVALRRALKPTTPKEMKAVHKEAFRQEQVEWLREHPGKTAKDFRRLSTGDLMAWRAPKNRAYLAAERQAWERDHPGEQYPEHLCGLSDADYVRYQRWEERWKKGRRRRRAKPIGGIMRALCLILALVALVSQARAQPLPPDQACSEIVKTLDRITGHRDSNKEAVRRGFIACQLFPTHSYAPGAPPPSGNVMDEIEPNPRGITRSEVEQAVAEWCQTHMDAPLCKKLERDR